MGEWVVTTTGRELVVGDSFFRCITTAMQSLVMKTCPYPCLNMLFQVLGSPSVNSLSVVLWVSSFVVNFADQLLSVCLIMELVAKFVF
jgi:hypothetical protein